MSTRQLTVQNGNHKIAKRLLLLGSDKDGEVLAAARALVRRLEAEGRDLHDLAAVLNDSTSSIIPEAESDWRSTALDCLRRQWQLRPGDRVFLHCVLKQSSISPAQANWLGDIAARTEVR